MIKILILFTVLMLALPVRAQIVDGVKYGECIVYTKNVGTERYGHALDCSEDRYDSRYVILACFKSYYAMTFAEKDTSHISNSVSVLFRFDNQQLFSMTAEWLSKERVAFIYGKTVQTIFLRGIASANYLFINVGGRESIIDLIGAAAAVPEYQRRCAKLMQGRVLQ